METGRMDGKATGQRTAGHNPENCPVCLMAFDDAVQRPRNLPCGHSFCTPCINGLEERDQVICPTCRVIHNVPEAGHFPINYTLEAVLRRLRDIAVASATRSPGTGKGTNEAKTFSQKGAAGLSRSMNTLLQEQEAKVLTVIAACKEMQSQLDKYQATLTGWHEHHQQFENKLQAVIDNTKSSRVTVRQEETRVAVKKNQVQQGEQQLHAALNTLRKVTTEMEAGMAFANTVCSTDDAETRLAECREMFPDVHTTRKVMATSNASREAFKSVLTDLRKAHIPAVTEDDQRDSQAAPPSTITDRLQAVQTLSLKTELLRTLTQPTRSLLQAGLVFATHKAEGQTRYAKITFEDGRLYLHCLQDLAMSPGAAILQVEELVPAAPPCLVFLDLAWPGSSQRRVVIRLNPDTPLGRQFVLLCTGQLGKSYVKTRLWVKNRGKPGEWVGGAACNNTGRTGEAAPLPNLDKCKYRKSSTAGAVCRVWRGADDNDEDGGGGGGGGGGVGGNHGGGYDHDGGRDHSGIVAVDDDEDDEDEDDDDDEDDEWNTMFGIRIRAGYAANGVFGEVVNGLEDVAAAAQHIPMKEVNVVDCGVVLWA